MIDYHIHSDISADCAVPMMLMAQAARKKGLREICFTEHIDLDFPGATDFAPDFDAYDLKFEALISAFADITIRKGIEAGLELRTKQSLEELVSGMSFDYIIGSVHLVGGLDPYASEFWEKYTLRQAFEEYVNVCTECVQEFEFYDVFGHLGYVSKFCPHENAVLRRADYSGAVDMLLKLLIDKGKGLEVNTSGIKNTGSAMPEINIIKRFFELGGEIVTVGSDAHEETSVGHAADETLDMLKGIGFKYVCAYDKRRPRFITIP